MTLRRSARIAGLILFGALLTAGSGGAGTIFKPADFDDDAKVPDPNRTVGIFWPSGDKKDAKNPSDLTIHTLGQNGGQFKNEFGPGRQGDQPLQYEPDPDLPGKKKVYGAESQEGLSGSKAPKGLKNWDTATPVHYRVYTISPPVDASLYDDNVNHIVTQFDNADPKKNQQVIVSYEWSLTPKAATDKVGTFEFLQTKADLEQADGQKDVDGKKISDPAILGGSAWLPFADLDASGNLKNQQPAPFNGKPAKGILKDNTDRVPPFSYTASTPGDFFISFKLNVKRNDGSAAGKDDPAESGEAKKHLEVANLTPPMLMTGAAPGPVFSTTGDLLDNELGQRTPDFSQDDLYTVIWVMSNAHSGQAVDRYSADHVEKLTVNYPKFEDVGTYAFMPKQDENVTVDPITGEITSAAVYNGGDFFGISSQGSNQSAAAGTPPLQGGQTDITANKNLMDRALADEFAPKMDAAASKAKSMQEFADGTFQSAPLTKDILSKTPGKDGLVATIQLPSSFPMPECQQAMLSAFKVKVPITRAPVNFEGKIPWTVGAIAKGNAPAGTMDGSLAVIDNDPPDCTVAVNNPKAGTTKILQINGIGGGEHTLAPEPFAVRKGDLSANDSPIASSATSKDISPTTPPPGANPKPLQDQNQFPQADALTKIGLLNADGTSDIISLPDNFGAQKGAVVESIEIPSDTFPAD
ncbi:MAG: hypothetical protein HY303_13485 [Candidatus Wallbacteria bacterium]|nr:hypothetical protein [Candidatus Wallbacteria bacterium]